MMSLCVLHTSYLAGNSYQQWCDWSWENRSPYLIPCMDCICCARNICYGLNGKEDMLARCRGKQSCNQEVAGGLTTPAWCRFSHVCGDIHAPGLIGHQGVFSSIQLWSLHAGSLTVGLKDFTLIIGPTGTIPDALNVSSRGRRLHGCRHHRCHCHWKILIMYNIFNI